MAWFRADLPRRSLLSRRRAPCGLAARHAAPGRLRRLEQTDEMAEPKTTGVGGLFTLHLFVLPPTFIQTPLFDGEVYAAAADWS